MKNQIAKVMGKSESRKGEEVYMNKISNDTQIKKLLT